MNFLFDQKKNLNNIVVSVLTTIILLVGFSLGVLYNENKEIEKMSLEMPHLSNPLPITPMNEKPFRGIQKKINNTVPKNLPPVSDFNSLHLMHTVYPPRSSGYPKNYPMDFTLYVIYVNKGANPLIENLVSENSGWNRCGSTILTTRLLLMSLPVKNYSMDDDIKFR